MDDDEPAETLEMGDDSGGGARMDTASERVEGPVDHSDLEPADDRDGPDSEQSAPPPPPPGELSADAIYLEPTIDTTASEEVELGVTRPTPDSPGERASVESAQLEEGVVPTASEAVENPSEHAMLPEAADREGPDSDLSMYVVPSAACVTEILQAPISELSAEGVAADAAAGPSAAGSELRTSSSPIDLAGSTSVGLVGSTSTDVAAAASSLSQRTLLESQLELSAESVVHSYSGKVQLVHVPTVLLQASESEARRMIGLPDPVPEPTLLERIWRDPVQFHDVRSILSQIWAKDETVFHSLLSEIWATPAMRSVLSEIWEDAVQKVEPKSVLSEIWAEPPVHVDIRSVLSQIWSDDNKERIMSILSEIWSTPAMRSILSEIWGSDPVRSVLSEIWATPVEKVDIRSILSQIWSTDNDEPPPRSILSEIWATPAVRSVLSEIWGAPKLRSVLSEIWKEPVHKVDIRSVLSQIWSSDNDDEHVRSILSEIWATPAVRSVLSQIWHAESETQLDTHADYRVTESEMLLEELIEDLQKSEEDMAEEEAAARPPKQSLAEKEDDEHRKPRVHRYTPASDEADLPTSRPLTTRWAFGGSSKAPVINLTDETSKSIVYGAAQCAVIYDYCRNTQRILQGHRNCVCGLAASSNGRWIATGDVGQDNALIVWDAAASAPLQMHFPESTFSGPLALAFSCDCRYVFGLWGCVSGGDGDGDGSAAPVRARQQLIAWDWTMDQAEPTVIHEFKSSHGFHEHLAVSQLDPLVLATTAACRIMFFQMAETADRADHHSPQLRNAYSAEFKCNPGNFSQTAFFTDDPYSAITSTSKGYVVLWSDRRPSAPCDPQVLTPTINKEGRKVLNISEAPITCVQITDNIICAGTAAGEIRFLDQELRLLQWYPKFGLAAVRCLSFGLTRPRPADDEPAEPAAGDGGDSGDGATPAGGSAGWRAAADPCGPAGEAGPFPPDCSLEAAEFVVRDLVVTAADGFCGLVTIRTGACRQLAQFPVVTVRAMDVHQAKPHVVIGAYDGSIRVYDYEQKRLVDETRLTGNNKIHSIAFSPSGLHLAAGLQCGELVPLDGLTLRQVGDRFELSRDAITQCLFSPDSDLLATRDDDLVVSVYRFLAGSQQWVVLGRYRAHHRPIADLLFLPGPAEAPLPRLLSLGEDRVLVEYDLVNSTKEKPLVLCCDTLEQSAVPLCMALYPSLTAESFILVSNSQYKMKLHNAHTRMCRSVVVGPQYGSPVERMKVVPRMLSCDLGPTQEQHSYLAFSTGGKLGLQILPMDGNPRKAAAVIGHPSKVERLDCSADGRWLFSAGGEDGCVFMWEVYPESLEAMSMLGGAGMTPFYDQLPGGKEGRLYQELEDLVYYTELVCEGEGLLEQRHVSQRVPLHTVTDILRAIGFFPTEKEIEDMMNEVRYREYAETGQLVEEVNLDDIIRLYVNHRPTQAATAGQLSWALVALSRGSRHHRSGAVSRKELVRALQAKGEHMSEKELAGVLAELLDPAAETLPLGVPLDTVEHQLPKVLTLKSLCSDLLGMPELLTEQTTSSPSWSSQDDSSPFRSASPRESAAQRPGAIP